MENNHTTYTYTARSVNRPDNVITFTLDDGHMRVNLTGLLEGASLVTQAEEKSDELKQQVTTQAKPAALKIAEQISGPVHVSDVQASLDDERLKVSLWQRLAGLRLAPIQLNMGRIDNRNAAEDFIKELKERQAEEAHIGKFFGPLDYWFGWIALGLVIVFLVRWPGRKNA
ncbi:MAG: hypothetical protein ACK2U1_10660 [Anaerolineales bacterium]